MTTTELREQQDRMARIDRIEKMTAAASGSVPAGLPNEGTYLKMSGVPSGRSLVFGSLREGR